MSSNGSDAEEEGSGAETGEAGDGEAAANIYLDDLVELRRVGGGGRRQVGVVIRTAWHSDDEFDEDDEDDEAGRLNAGEVEVVWLEGDADIVDAPQLQALDRLLVLGDAVESVSAPRGQGPFATVIDVQVTASIEAVESNRAGTAPLFRRRGVDVRTELARAFAVDAGTLVVFRCFMGIVRCVVFDMDVSAAGRTVTLKGVSLQTLDIVPDDGIEPRGPPLSELADLELGRSYSLPVAEALSFVDAAQARALGQLAALEFVSVELTALRAHSAQVHWMGAPAGRHGDSPDVPQEIMRIDQLAPLHPYADTASFVVSNIAKVVATGRLCKVTLTRTTVDLRWQDGTIERGRRAVDFLPVQHLLEQDHFPGDFVVNEDADERAKSASALSQSPPADAAAGSPAGVGAAGEAVSANLDSLDHALDLLLGAAPPASASASTSALADPLAARLSLQRRLGCVVTVQHAAQTCTVLWLHEPSANGGSVLEHGVPSFSVKPHRDSAEMRLSDFVTLLPEHPSLRQTPPPPFAGVFKDVDLTTGQLIVRWSDDTESRVDVLDVQRIDPDPILDMLDRDGMDDDEYDDDDGEEYDERAAFDEEDDVNGDGDGGGDALGGVTGESLLSMIDAAGLADRTTILPMLSALVRDLTRGPQPASRAAVKLYCAAQRYTPLFLPPGEAVEPFPTSLAAFNAKLQTQAAFVFLLTAINGEADYRWFYDTCRAHVQSVLAAPSRPAIATTTTAANGEPAAVEAVAAVAPAEAAAAACELFFASSGAPPPASATLTAVDLLSLEGATLPAAAHGSSHKFADEPVEFRDAQRTMREWTQLQSGLPASGVGVRVYEERLDLLKLVVLGSAGTPYEDVPFFFDVRFPADYPNVAPQVHFVAFVPTKLHPNLNVDGNVCLSLLGTWSGDETESWRGADSSVLQLAMSLQGLVLGDSEPYFLEAGFERQRGTAEGHRNSKRYTERALVFVIRHLIHVVARCAQDVHFERLHKAAAPAAATDDDDDESNGGGVFGFRKMLRAHFLARGDAIVARFKAHAAADGPHSQGFRTAFAPIVERLVRAIATLKRLLAEQQ